MSWSQAVSSFSPTSAVHDAWSIDGTLLQQVERPLHPVPPPVPPCLVLLLLLPVPVPVVLDELHPIAVTPNATKKSPVNAVLNDFTIVLPDSRVERPPDDAIGARASRDRMAAAYAMGRGPDKNRRVVQMDD